MQDKVFDLIIIGAGPAGLAAGSYAGRARLDTLIIEKEKDGGQIVITAEIDNYPGSVENESGPSLIARMAKQAEGFGAQKLYDTVTDVDLSGDIKIITCKKGVYKCRALIIATGAHPRPIGCPGEKELIGKGVSYCATCDGAFFEDMEIFVVGGGDTAVEEAVYLTRFGRSVTIIHRRDKLRAVQGIQDRAFKNDKIKFMWDSVVDELKGDGILESMVIKNTKTGEKTEIFAAPEDGTFGVFVFIGFLPESGIFEGKVAMQDGYIITNEKMETDVKGVYAAGDVRITPLRQVVTAASDGAIAAMQVYHYLENL